VTVGELAYRTGLSPAAANSVLAQLEGEGIVLRGHFRRDIEEEEFCNRRLLARIHRYTLDRLRQEIEPVTAQDLMRFLFRWQHVAPGTQFEGKRGLLEAVTQLQGFDVPAVAWERHILPARVTEYRGSWLDELCMSGDIAWARFGLKKNGDATRQSSASSATPLSLARRADLDWLIAGIRNGGAPTAPSAGAGRDVLDLLESKGALFYDDVVRESGRLATDVERGMWDLVARGLITADGFQALRSLMASTKRRSFRRPARARLFRTLATGTPSGRWSLLPTAPRPLDAPASAHPEPVEGRADDNGHHDNAPFSPEDLAEAWAEQLLFRYGVVFRDLVKREGISVPWRNILRQLRRMEAQGLVRGGRFVGGFYGEQYARPEAVESLRKVRRIAKSDELVRVSAVDPLNLAGIITPGAKVPAIHTKSVVFRDGVPITEEEAERLASEARLAAAAS
jgi:ATP-dependent Lhr-like helicase